jgi:hypothetical protein
MTLNKIVGVLSLIHYFKYMFFTPGLTQVPFLDKQTSYGTIST